MNESTENCETYINTVRKSLYKNPNKKNDKTPKKSRKIKLGLHSYESADVFCNLNDSPKKNKDKKYPKRHFSSSEEFEDEGKKVERKKKVKPQKNQNVSPSISEQSERPNFYPFQKHFPKKKLGRLTTEDFYLNEFEDEGKKAELKKKVKPQKNQNVSPSISEQSEQIDFYPFQKNSRRKLGRLTTEDFDLNEFFDDKEPTVNDSFSESHSGIDYEFLRKRISKVQITSKSVYDVDQDVCYVSSESEVDEEDVDCDYSNRHQGQNYTSINRADITDNNEIIELPKDHAPLELLSEAESELASTNEQNDSVLKENIISSEEIININVERPQNYQQRSPCKYFDIGTQKLVLLRRNASVSFFGLCSLKVIHGKIEILGSVLTKQAKEVDVYSPRGSSLLVIKNLTINDEKDDLKVIQHILDSNEALKDQVEEENTAIFMCSRIDSYKILFVEKHISQQIFPRKENNRVPQIFFDPKDRFNVTVNNSKWDEVIDVIDFSTRLLIAGGKGVGKSTFLRYSINRLLSRFEKVRIIDLDPGQSEFSVPGCIYVVTVTEPVLGPNYTHLLKPDWSYLSDINIGHDPRKYLELIKSLPRANNDCPTLINYLGFASGIGLKIISSAITYLKPTHVIQIESKSHKKNFASNLTLSTVEKNCGLFGGNTKNLNFTLLNISAMTDDNAGWSLEPRQARELCILAYFGEMMKSGVETLHSHLLPMYEIGLHSIQLSDSKGNKVPPAAVNANMVALCSKVDRNKIFNVFGFGIVRCVDLKTRTLVLITPVDIETLQRVFYLVLSSVFLPPSVYMTTEDVTGPIPYVMKGELDGLGEITKRSYIPVNKK